ncbi:MAG TPA: cardiolipin synthase B [Gammaproteobacteria bacterium]|nr:cardiolipin synthase B [Gammaproteobacteria bacterium]
MLAAIGSARRDIRLESYIFADDELGRRFAHALVEQARAGISVRVHLDAAGSLFWSGAALARRMAAGGVALRWFHRWDWRRPWRYNRRHHRKLLVIDGSIGWTGGFNIHRENSLALYGPERWRDTHVRFRDGLARQAALRFDEFWQRRRRPPPPDQGRDQIISNYARGGRRDMNGRFHRLIAQAEHNIQLTTPYFVPDAHTQQLLRKAARRGVEVHILVPRKSDVWLAQWAARASYSLLLDDGVHIHEYLPRLLHAKTLLVDNRHAVIGTSNIDYRSFFLNYELNLFSTNPGLCQALARCFEQDLAESEAITAQYWSRRFGGQRLLELAGWAARRWL